MFHKLKNVRFAALRAAVPANEIRLADEVEYYGGSVKKVARITATVGMDRRRICPPDVTASDLCVCAAESIFAAMPEIRSEIDALIFVSQAPDWHQPATACELQNRMGLPQTCAAFDVNQGCTGYMYGLWIASSFIASGAVKKALVLVGDAHTGGRDVRNRITTPVFGDGGSATLLVRDENAPPICFDFGTDGAGFELIITPGGGARIPALRDMSKNAAFAEDFFDPWGNPWQLGEVYMDGGAVFNFTMDVVPNHIKEVLASAGLGPEDINWLILHQANKHIVKTLAEKSGFPADKAPADSFSRYGNLAAASIPAALCDSLGNEKSPGRVFMCGYGIGLAWGSCICDLENWNCAPVIEFEPDPGRPTREERIERWIKIMKGEIAANDQSGLS